MLRRLLALVALMTGFALFAAPAHAMPVSATSSAPATADSASWKVTPDNAARSVTQTRLAAPVISEVIADFFGQSTGNVGFIVRVDRARE